MQKIKFMHSVGVIAFILSILNPNNTIKAVEPNMDNQITENTYWQRLSDAPNRNPDATNDNRIEQLTLNETQPSLNSWTQMPQALYAWMQPPPKFGEKGIIFWFARN